MHLATLGGAKALYLDDRLGNFLPGKDADFVVIDLKATPLIDYRLRQSKSLEETLFALISLGDGSRDPGHLCRRALCAPARVKPSLAGANVGQLPR